VIIVGISYGTVGFIYTPPNLFVFQAVYGKSNMLPLDSSTSPICSKYQRFVFA